MTTSRTILGLGLAAAALASFAAMRPASAQTINNFSFETKVTAGYTVPPGWTATGGGTIGGGSNGVGIDFGGTFANNGVIPDGSQVAFLQTDGNSVTTLAQTINGLKIGDQYVISFYDNSRAGYGAPTLNVSFGGQAIAAPQTVTSVGGANSYHFITGTAYTATGTSATLVFAASIPTGGDSTALIDNVTIRDISAPVPEASTTASLGLLLALGLGGGVVARRKKAAR